MFKIFIIAGDFHMMIFVLLSKQLQASLFALLLSLFRTCVISFVSYYLFLNLMQFLLFLSLMSRCFVVALTSLFEKSARANVLDFVIIFEDHEK